MMSDRETFEDEEMIRRYRRVEPIPNTAYRPRLRARLERAPVPRRRKLPHVQWMWTAGASAVVAIAVAFGLLLLPLGSHTDTPLNPRAVLARAVSAGTNPTPYRGSAEMSFVQESGVRGEAPAAALPDASTHHIITTWAVHDLTHWRVDVYVLSPALQSEHQIAVADGKSVTWYRGIDHRAIRYPLIQPQLGGSLLNALQGGRGVPLAQTLAQYLQALNNPSTHTHARVVGTQTILGRPTDILDVWPVVRGSTTGPCNNAQQCAKNTKQIGYGRARIWIDRAHGLVLRYKEYDMPTGGDFDRNFVYKVTSLTYGSGPSKAELAYRSPALSVTAGTSATNSQGSGGIGERPRWQIPTGFIPVAVPSDGQGHRYTVGGTGQYSDGLLPVSSINAVFLSTPSQVDFNHPSKGPYVYVQEQYRSNGLPTFFAGGTSHAAGRCTAYTGTYPDGIHWLALARGKISLLAVANRLGEASLVKWAAARICA
jgi:hypothetical protein